jgi:hypothetical protein
MYQFVAKTDLPTPLPTCFTVGSEHCVDRCFTQERCQELVTKPGARGLVGRESGVVEESECDRNPKLPSYKDLLSVGRKRSTKRGKTAIPKKKANR